MKCQKCSQREANVHVVKSINGNIVEYHLCEKCAAEEPDIEMNPLLGLNSLLTGMFNIGGHFGNAGLSGTVSGTGNSTSSGINKSGFSPAACDRCGMTLHEFQQKGRLGCAACYDKFGPRLEPIFKRLHGSVVHKGRMPGNVAEDLKIDREMERLRELLNKAIHEEAYEKAAELRDEIKVLEAKKNQALRPVSPAPADAPKEGRAEAPRRARNPRSPKKKDGSMNEDNEKEGGDQK